MGVRIWLGASLIALSLCASGKAFACDGVVQDPPDTSHANSGSIALGKDGCLHSRPAYDPGAAPQAQRYAAEESAAHDLRARRIAEARAVAARGEVTVPPLSERYAIYARINRMTAQQIAAMSKEDQRVIQCEQIAEMIDEELAIERDGWQRPLYSLESLRTHPGLEDCWPYFMSLR